MSVSVFYRPEAFSVYAPLKTKIVFWSHTSNKTNRIPVLKNSILTQLCTSLEMQLRAERKVSNTRNALASYFRQETLSNPNFRATKTQPVLESSPEATPTPCRQAG